MNPRASLITDNGVTIFYDGAQYVSPADHPNYRAILDALAEDRWEDIPALIDMRESVRDFLSNDPDFKLENDRIVLHDRPFSEAVTDKVLDMLNVGNDAEPLFRFLRNVRENPSAVAQDELLLFCVANNFMISEDGCILAYKSVNGNYTAIHDGTTLNRVGDAPYMERNAVDDRRERTCSYGYHFASHKYASTWAGKIDGVSLRLMLLKVNPADVVSIPNDYNNQKGRCNTYEVIAELTVKGALPKQEVYSEDDLSDYCDVCGKPLSDHEDDDGI